MSLLLLLLIRHRARSVACCWLNKSAAPQQRHDGLTTRCLVVAIHLSSFLSASALCVYNLDFVREICFRNMNSDLSSRDDGSRAWWPTVMSILINRCSSFCSWISLFWGFLVKPLALLVYSVPVGSLAGGSMWVAEVVLVLWTLQRLFISQNIFNFRIRQTALCSNKLSCCTYVPHSSFWV